MIIESVATSKGKIPQELIDNMRLSHSLPQDTKDPIYVVRYKDGQDDFIACNGYLLHVSRIVCREIKALGYQSWITVDE